MLENLLNLFLALKAKKKVASARAQYVSLTSWACQHTLLSYTKLLQVGQEVGLVNIYNYKPMPSGTLYVKHEQQTSLTILTKNLG